MPRSKVTVIYNGVISRDFEQKSSLPVTHPWFGLNIPVIVAAGRMVEQKDFATLIKAFAAVARQRDVRLVLLGDGPLRAALVALTKTLNVTDRIDMPGFKANPLPYLRAADLVVMSSCYEGFGMVLAEALACGTPAVSTDCPHGPAEILEHGRVGRLAPPQNPEALAQAIIETLDNPPPVQVLLERARSFGIGACADGYLKVFFDVSMPHERTSA
jgi:glycosyltransferase involved in cell wall biosynthesis